MAGDRTAEPRHLAVALALQVDAVTAEVVGAFRSSGIPSILLRGPAVATWLYPDEGRPYGDMDLLVPARAVSRAATCLEELGFEDVSVAGVLRGDRPPHARTWARQRRDLVDLHTTVVGVRLPPDDAWAILAEHTAGMNVAGMEIEILREPARALMLVLHAAQHGARSPATLEDLRRALAQLQFATWTHASSLAEQLDAADAFAAGLRLAPDGAEVADALGLPATARVDVAIRAGTAPPMALGFEWLSQTPGWRGKAALTGRKIVPSPTFMRAWSPLAGRGRAGLALAYAWRPIWLALHAGPAFIAWRRARHEADDAR